MHRSAFMAVFRVVLPLLMIVALLVSMFRSSTSALAAGVPAATLTVPAESFIGEPLTFTVAFDNTGPDTGYGPYMDVYLPAAGADGAGSANDDGITFNSATYLGVALTPVVAPFICTGSFVHPLTGEPTTCTVDTQVVILQMPFGSFTPNQPAAPVIVNAILSNMADVGTPLAIQAQAGFMYGNDPLDDPTTDPPIVGMVASASVTPTLLKLKKTYIGPEDETATGPNFPRDYQISVDIANGQTITNLDITDLLPKELQFVQIVSATPASCNIAAPVAMPPTTAPQNPPNNRLTVRCPGVTGTISSIDAALTLRFFVPRLDADGNAVLPPDTADANISVNDAVAEGDWTPIDPRDAQTHVVSDVTKADHRLEDQAIAIQKSFFTATDVGSPGYTPGDVLAYSLDFQISDFFAFDQVVVTDVLSDGLHIDPSFPPTLQINGNTYTLAAAPIATNNYTIDTSQIGNDTDPATDGSTRLIFRVSDEIVSRNAGTLGRMVGGCVQPTGTNNPAPDCAAYNDGATTGKIVYHAIIQDEFTDTYLPQDKYVDHGDKLGNAAVINGRVLDTTDLANPTGFEEADDTFAGLTLAFGQLNKSIYAVNGSTTLPEPLRVQPGDTLTYRFRYTLPSSNFEDLRFTDYLPLPVFDATESTTFSPSGGIPPAGTATYGPNDTYHMLTGGPTPLTPTISTSGPSADNTVTFNYGSYKDPQNRTSDIDLLFTVTVSNQPFADGLFLTNQVRAYEGTTNAGDQTLDSIVQIKLAEPVLGIRKGVVATNNPSGAFSPTQIGPVAFTAPGGACARFSGTITSPGLATSPIDSNLSTVDAGDLVTFAIVVENTGSIDAFDVRIRDTLPAGFSVPGSGLNLCVTDGTGAPMGYTALGSGLFDESGGIELNDSGSGALDAGKDPDETLVSSGRNLAIITYDLVVDPTVTARQALTNTATLFNYANAEGGPDFTASDKTDDAVVTIAPPSLNKQLSGTEINHANNTAAQAVIGELATYTLTLRVPEGVTPGAKIVDTLDSGLAFVDMISATPSSGVSMSNSATPVVTNSGGTITFSFGDITNTNNDNTTPDTITLVYRVVVLNVAGNANGKQLHNSATLTWTGNSLPSVSAANVQVIEPKITIAKTVAVNGSGTSGDAGDPVHYTITLGGATIADAFDVTLSDPLPAYIEAPAITSVIDSAGMLTAANFQITGGTLSSVASFDMPVNAGRTITIVVSGTLTNSVQSGQVINNTARIQWTSMSGDPGTRSTYNTNATERTGSGGVNNYAASGSAALTVLTSAPEKSIVGTSEPHTGCTSANSLPCVERVALGEIVRYRLSMRLAEGTSPNVQLADQIDANMRFLNDGTARVAFVSNGGGITSTMIDSGMPGCANLNVIGNSRDVTPTCPLPNASILGSPFNNSTDPTFSLGDMVNSDNDTDEEYIVIELNVLVSNATGNSLYTSGGSLLGRTRKNTFTVSVNGVTTDTSNPVNVTTTEPVLSPLSKQVAPTTPLDAGDLVTYTLTYTNTGSGVYNVAAFDLVMTDTLDANLVPQSVTGTATGGACGDTPSTFTGAITDQTVTTTVSCLNPGDKVTTTIVAKVVADVPGGLSIPNSASLTWSSLPGNGTPVSTSANPTSNLTGSATPGASGSATGERNGADGPDGSLNNYARISNAISTTVAEPQIAKQPPTPTSYTIGDVITYYIQVTLPEGVTRGLVVQDMLPDGLAYVGHQVITSATASAGNMTQDYSGSLPDPAVMLPGSSGGTLALDFGDTTTPGDNNPGNNRFVVQVVARVLNAAANQQGSILTNSAALLYKPGSSASASMVSGGDADITVVEPELLMTKTVSQPSANPGDLVTYTLTVSHPAGDAETAYDVVISDTLPAGLTYEAGSARISSGPAGTTVYTAPDTLNWFFPAIAPNEQAIMTFQARVTDPALASATNTANVTWTSMPGTNAYERTGSGGVNDYSVNASVPLLTTSYQISKTLLAPAGGLAGMNDTVRFSIVVTNTGATALATVPLTDTYDPAFLTYQSATPASDDNTDDGTINWTNIASGDPIAPGATRTVTVTFKAKAPTLPGSTTNQAAASGVEDSNGTRLPPHGDNASVSIGQPDLRISKTDAQEFIIPGDTLTYTLTVTNSGTYTATGVVITETLPLYTSFGGPAGWTGQGGRMYTYAVGDLPPGASASASFIAHVNSTLPTNITQIVNTARVGDNGAHGEPTPGNNSATDTDTIEAVPDLTLSKNDYIDFSFPGAIVIYTLDYHNTGNQDATGVLITETVPLYTTFSASASTAGWSCASGAAAGTTCTFDLGTVAAGDGGNVRFAVKIADSLPAGIERVYNTAVIVDDNGNGDDPTPDNNTAEDDTPIQAAPDMQISKSDAGITAVAGGAITYTLTYTNAGNQDATGVIITETLPLHTSFSGPAGWTDQGSGVYTYHVGNLAAGASGSVTFMVKLDAPLVAGITQVPNTASIADDGSNGDDPTPDDNEDSVTTPVAALAISKTRVDPAGGLAGVNDTVRFSIVVTNTGATALATVPLTDAYDPAVLQFASASMPPDSATAGTLRWNDLTGAGALAPGQTIMVDVTFQALMPTVKGTNNHASVSGAVDAGGTVLPTGSDTADVMIGQPDLRISKTDGQTSVMPGDTITYTLTVTNSGTYTATGVVITDPLPDYTSFDGGGVNWENLKEDGNFTHTLDAPLGPGESITVTFRVTVDATVPAGVTQITNIASVADDGAHGADPTPANNTATDIDALVAAPDLALSKTHVDDFLVGHEGSYLLQVTNHGNTGTTGTITITDTLPNGMSYMSASGADWVCSANGQALTCTHPGPLEAGDSLPDLTLTVHVGAAAWPAVTNSAVVGTAGEGDPIDNRASDPTTVRAPDLQLSKRVASGSLAPGAAVMYTLVYTNTGNHDASGVIITEHVPEHTSFNAAASDTGWTCASMSAGSACTFDVGAVAQGVTGYATFSVIIDPALPPSVTTIMNTASVADDHEHGDDPTDAGNPVNNNQATARLAAPTAVTLLSFAASMQNDGVVVQWQTGAEIDTMGFDLYRSADSSRAHAERVTPTTILARGRGQGGASYSWTDTTAQPGVDYHYWLVETETDGVAHEYGPVTVGRQLAAQTRIFLPLMGR